MNKGYKRYVKVGSFPVGRNNLITDVSGVKVGHFTINESNINTGITAILPHDRNIFQEKVIAANYVFNGFGKSIGLVQVEELGTIETPIILTNTLAIGTATTGLIKYMLSTNKDIADSTSTVNPLVLECNDGYLNDIRNIRITANNVKTAINGANEIFPQGNVGAGTGMRCLGFKGGIGSSSRIININNTEYTIGILVNSNFQGNSSTELKINGFPLGQQLNKDKEGSSDQGSIIVIVATDLPLSNRQLKRLARRAVLGIGNVGGYATHGSGDIILCFSTSNKIKHSSNQSFLNLRIVDDKYLSPAFKATVDATEEAIINSLMNAETMIGYKGRVVESLKVYEDTFKNLLIKE